MRRPTLNFSRPAPAPRARTPPRPTQIAKLGIADHLRSELSARFLWWDLDMVPVAPVQLFDTRSDQPVLAVGGKRIRAYGRAYERLSGGGRLATAPDGSSFVTHSMVGAFLCRCRAPMSQFPLCLQTTHSHATRVRRRGNAAESPPTVIAAACRIGFRFQRRTPVATVLECPHLSSPAVDRAVLNNMLAAFSGSPGSMLSGDGAAEAAGDVVAGAGGRGGPPTPPQAEWPWQILGALDEAHPELVRWALCERRRSPDLARSSLLYKRCASCCLACALRSRDGWLV